MPSINSTVIPGDCHVNGTLSLRHITVPEGELDGSAISSSVPVPSASQIQRFRGALIQESLASEGDERRIVGIVQGDTGLIRSIKITNVTPAVGVAIAEFDLLVNGVSVMNSVVELNSATLAYEVKSGVILTTALVVDDVIEISLAFTTGAGTAPLGCGAVVEWDEDPV